VDPRLDAWLSILHDQDGTDILLTDGSKPLLRVDGRLVPLEEAEVLTGEEIEAIARTQLHDQYGDRLHLGKEVDFSFSWRDRARIRASAFYQRNQCALSMRRIPMRIPGLDELGLPEALSRILRSPSGLILVTGPPGSGKTTSMAAMIDVINRVRACHIVTIEDPIEYLHQNQKAAVSQREVGTDTESFGQALKSVLREDPDVVLVGALRDAESIAAALTIAETGHLVITTLHADDPAQAVDRIVDVFPPERSNEIQVKLAATLLAVLHQRLVPRVDGGVVAACELMLGVPEVRALVREAKTARLREVVDIHRPEGMQTLEDSLATLLRAGIIDYETAVSASFHPREILRPTPVAATSRA
jgi:twitching motility protein PilT